MGLQLSLRDLLEVKWKGVVLDTNPSDMDSIRAVYDSDIGVDSTLTIASCIDMVMTMMADLSNKVTMLEWVPQISTVPA